MFSRTKQVIRITRDPGEPTRVRPWASMNRTPHTNRTEISSQLNTENALNPRPNYWVCQKFEAPNMEETTSNIDNPNKTWVIKKVTWVGRAQTDNNQYNYLLIQGARGDKGNKKNNTKRNATNTETTITDNKDHN